MCAVTFLFTSHSATGMPLIVLQLCRNMLTTDYRKLVLSPLKYRILIFCTMTIKSTINWQITTLLYVSTLLCHLQDAKHDGSINIQTVYTATEQTGFKLLKMDVLTFETHWAVNGEIIKRVTSSWSIFIELHLLCHRQYNSRFLQVFCSTSISFMRSDRTVNLMCRTCNMF